MASSEALVISRSCTLRSRRAVATSSFTWSGGFAGWPLDLVGLCRDRVGLCNQLVVVVVVGLCSSPYAPPSGRAAADSSNCCSTDAMTMGPRLDAPLVGGDDDASEGVTLVVSPWPGVPGAARRNLGWPTWSGRAVCTLASRRC